MRQVVFRGGEGALQVLPPLIDVIPEARLNLVIYYLRQGVQPQLSPRRTSRLHKHSLLCLKSADDVQEAYSLIQDVVPVTPQVTPRLPRGGCGRARPCTGACCAPSWGQSGGVKQAS